MAAGSPFIDADGFGAAQHPQDIAAGELGEVLVGPAAADQLGEQVRIALDAFEALGRVGIPSMSPPIPTWS